MKIGIGKIGQKLIFDRSSKDATRSSLNGNVSVWAFFNMLLELNPNDDFYMLTDYDCLPYNNLFDKSSIDLTTLDICILFAGINNDPIIDLINSLKLKYILVSEDMRCLDNINNNIDIKQVPEVILGQSNKQYKFKNKLYNMQYIPIEYAQVYSLPTQSLTKEKDICILSSWSSIYPRLKITKKLTKNTDYEVYGRLEKPDKYPPNFKGEVGYQQAQDNLSKSYLTLTIPVAKNIITTKYIEALMNDCLPLFWKDYNTKQLGVSKDLIVKSRKDLINKVNKYVSDSDLYNATLKELKDKFIEPNKDGIYLNNLIKELICQVLKKS